MTFSIYVVAYSVFFLQGAGSETGKGGRAGEVEGGEGGDSNEGMESGKVGVHGR